MVAEAAQHARRSERAWGLRVVQIAFALLVLVDVVLLKWLLDIHELSVWGWASVVVPTVLFLLFLSTGIADWKDQRLRRLIADSLLMRVRPLLVVCVVLLCLAGLLTALITHFYRGKHSRITFEQFVAQYNAKKSAHPAALAEFAKDREGDHIEWDCFIVEAFRDMNAYRIAVKKDSPREQEAHAVFARSGDFQPSRVGRARIEGTIRKVDEVGIRLKDCRFADNGI